MKLQSIFAAAVLIVSACPVAAAAEAPPPRVQLAILLDTSSSMQGLIDQAKTQLWKIVNEFISARQDGKVPHVEVALYEYGRNSLLAENHWVRQIQPLTRDLDKISEELFKLTISASGCEEYPGAAISHAVKNLAWDERPNIYKAIFVAGNEPFTQGPVDPAMSSRCAIAKGIIVNTVHCGTESDGLAGQWDVCPKLADGKFMNIDHNRTVARIEAPQDAEIVKLNGDLNRTYVWYGPHAAQKRMNQLAQDANAAAGAAVERTTSKASANYYQADADLVDASKEPAFEITKLKDDELPAELKSMTPEERREFIDKKAQERADLQKRILELTKAREAFVVEKLKSVNGETLDTAVTRTIREQAGKKQIVWEK